MNIRLNSNSLKYFEALSDLVPDSVLRDASIDQSKKTLDGLIEQTRFQVREYCEHSTTRTNISVVVNFYNFHKGDIIPHVVQVDWVIE